MRKPKTAEEKQEEFWRKRGLALRAAKYRRDNNEASWDGLPLGVVAKSQTNHPETSHDAADQMNEGGPESQANKQGLEVLAALRKSCGMTAYEVDVLLYDNRHTAGKRLPDLEALGLVTRTHHRRANPSGASAFVWVAT